MTGTFPSLDGLRSNPDWANLPIFDRTGWRMLPFGEFAQSINERVEPSEVAEDIYVGLEHLDPQSLHIQRWGKPSIAAVDSTGASFDNRTDMVDWLSSADVIRLSRRDGWPTVQSRHAWLQFFNEEKQGNRQVWKRKFQRIRVKWSYEAPVDGTSVVIEPTSGTLGGLVLTPDLITLGNFTSTLIMPRRYIVNAQVVNRYGGVSIEYFGPLIV